MDLYSDVGQNAGVGNKLQVCRAISEAYGVLDVRATTFNDKKRRAMGASRTMAMVVVATILIWLAGTPCAALGSDAGKGAVGRSDSATVAPACEAAVRAGHNKFWLKNGTKMPILLRKLADDSLSGDIASFKKTYGKAVNRAKLIDASYANRKTSYLRHPHYFEDQLTHDLDAAALTGHVRIIDFLVKHGVDPDGVSTTETETEPSIMLAALCNRVDAMQTLLNVGANINATVPPDSRDDTGPIDAVEEAILMGNKESVTWLLNHGANVCLHSTRKRISQILARPGISSRIGSDLRKRLQCK